MRITNIQNSNFSHLKNKPNTANPAEAQNSATEKASTSRQLVTAQPTEYKRFNSTQRYNSNPFLAQYIHQTNNQRSRGFIGRKPAWQAKKSYENSTEILEYDNISYLDKSI